jgi:ankyrin repeat protein
MAWPLAASSWQLELFAAAKHGDRDTFRELIKRGADPNAAHHPDGQTALHAAAAAGNVEVVQELVQLGANPDALTKNRRSALALAVRQGHRDVAAVLLAAHAAVNTADSSGSTPLHEATARGYLPIMEQLLDASASVSAADSTGCTPLHHASSGSKPQAVSLLLERGAPVDAKGAKGYTPLHYAAQQGDNEIVQLLLDAGAPVNAESSSGGTTPLILASHTGSQQLVQLLLDRGAHAATRDSSGMSALHVAADLDHVGVVRLLLQANSSKEHVNAMNSSGRTPLQRALLLRNTEVVQLLLEAGADVAAAGADGYNALHAMASGSLTAASQQVVAAAAGLGGAALHAVYRGLTPLQWAVEKGQTSCVEALLAAGVSPNRLYGAGAMGQQAEAFTQASLAGATMLHRAIQLKRAALVPLLATPANMDRWWQGNTPLHLALSTTDFPSLAQALVAAGSPAGLANPVGDTAMWVAATSRKPVVQDLLPAMVRRECERYKQLQQGGDGQQQPQGAGQQEAPAAVLATVFQAVYALLAAPPADERKNNCETLVACFRAWWEVLGEASAAQLLQQVLDKACSNSDSRVRWLTVQVVHKGWLQEVWPLMKQRRDVTRRLQQLVMQPLQSQTMEQQVQAAAAQAVAAAGAGQWPLFVQLLDQLTGLDKGRGAALLSQLLKQQAAGNGPDIAGLCRELLSAWMAAVQQVAGLMPEERKGAVLSAVQAAKAAAVGS